MAERGGGRREGAIGGDVDPFTREVADRLLRARDAKRLSLAETAAAAGLTKAYVWRVETGQQVPSVPMLARIAQSLGTTASDVLAGLEVDLAERPAKRTGRSGSGG